MDLYLSTSLWEGLPYSILEAISNKVPVVASNVDGNRDIIIDNQTGFLINALDISGTVNTVVNVLTNPEIAEKTSVNAEKLIKDHYRIRNNILQYEILYSS